MQTSPAGRKSNVALPVSSEASPRIMRDPNPSRAGTFTFGPATWDQRKVGDLDKVPWPSFVGNTASSLVFFRNRVGLTSDENVNLSGAGSFYNHFRTTLTTTLDRPYDVVVPEVRAALADQGFGVLTEIDIRATLAAKLGVDVPPQVILGACRPPLAHQALQIDPSIAAVLPCNVVVRALDDDTTLVEALDPEAMMGLAGPALAPVADEARTLLTAALAALTED